MGATSSYGIIKIYVKGVDAVVRSTAIREDNPEIVGCLKSKVLPFYTVPIL